MVAPKGNKYWEFREKHGRDFKYTAEKLWDEAVKYFEWVEANPLLEQKLFSYQGEIVKGEATKMRAMTITAFQLFADISDTTWENYCKNKDFIAITTRITNTVYSQKFEGAAADLLNPNIIAKDLGLAEKHDHQSSDRTMSPSNLSNLSTEELILRANASKDIEDKGKI